MRTTFFYVKNGARTHLKTAHFCPEKDLFLSLYRELEQSSLKSPKVKKANNIMEKLIRHSGNSRKLLSYQKTEVIFIPIIIS